MQLVEWQQACFQGSLPRDAGARQRGNKTGSPRRLKTTVPVLEASHAVHEWFEQSPRGLYWGGSSETFQLHASNFSYYAALKAAQYSPIASTLFRVRTHPWPLLSAGWRSNLGISVAWQARGSWTLVIIRTNRSPTRSGTAADLETRPPQTWQMTVRARHAHENAKTCLLSLKRCTPVLRKLIRILSALSVLCSSLLGCGYASATRSRYGSRP